MNRILLLLVGILSFATVAKAAGYQEMFPGSDRFSDQAKVVLSKIDFKQGAVRLAAAKATLNIPKDFYYLNPDDTRKVLVDIWHNPVSTAEGTLGMIFPTKYAPTESDAWGSVVEYDADGYVSDEDANSTDYGELLAEIQKSVSAENDERVKQGFPRITLAGWASPPHYDQATHAMHWARDLIFDDPKDAEHTLNYSVRVLGRSGVFEFDFVAGLSQLKEIQDAIPQVTTLVTYDTGAGYQDYREGDKLATYTVAGLIAAGAGAKIAAKVGLLAVAAVFFKKFAVLLLVVVGVVMRFFKRLFKRDKPST